MYKVAFKTKKNVKREFDNLEQAVNFALYMERKFIVEPIFILDENGKDITDEIEY